MFLHGLSLELCSGFLAFLHELDVPGVRCADFGQVSNLLCLLDLVLKLLQ